MPPDDTDRQALPGADTKADRRRAGRPAEINPSLVPLLRGQTDPDAPPDPVLAPPRQVADLLLGAALAATLLFLGVLIRAVV